MDWHDWWLRRCHDHKYDPLTMNEFYSFYAFFYSAADPAMDGNNSDTPPYLSLATPEQTAELERLRTIEQELDARCTHLAEAHVQQPAESVPPASENVQDLWLDDSLPIGATGSNTSRNRDVWSTTNDMDIPLGSRALKLAFGDYYQQKIDGGLIPRVIPSNGKLQFWLRIDGHNPSKTVMLELNTTAGQRRFGWGKTDLLRKGEFKSDNNNRHMGELPSTEKWHLMSIEAAQLNLPAGTVVNDMLLTQFGGISWIDGLSVQGLRSETDPRTSLGAWWSYAKDKNVPIVPKEVAAALKAGKKEGLSEGTLFQLQTQFAKWIARDVGVELAATRAALGRARDAVIRLEQSIPGTMIYRDLPEPRQAHLMKRGQYDQPADKVEPATPAFLPKLQLPEGQTRATRLDMAKWLVSPEHPLTARVTVNRFWQQVFGVGLVKTSDDFGTQVNLPRILNC